MKILLLVLTIISTTLAAGTRTGGGFRAIELETSWCKNTLTKLKAFRRNAVLIINTQGDYMKANASLQNGLIQSLEAESIEADDFIISYMRKSLERGVELAQHIELLKSNQDQNELESKYNLMISYYNFLISEVWELDNLGYFPYQSHLITNDSFSIDIYESNFVKYAYRQLELVNNTLLGEKGKSPIEVYPKGSASLYLRTLELFAYYTHLDLKDSLWQQALQCSSNDLYDIHQRLQIYNQGNNGEYGDDRIAVNDFYQNIVQILNQINSRRCP